MSSATSIDKVLPSKGGSHKKMRQSPRGFRLQAEDQPDAGFRPWHFFLLASLMAATVAVVMARQATPEHLILLSVIIAATGLAAAAFYRMLAPLAAEDASMFSEPLSERGRAALEREKILVLRSIKELEFDRAMGKVAPKDFDEMAGRLRARAIALMKQLDEGGGAGYRELIERELQARLTRGSKGSKGSAGSTGSGADGSDGSDGSAGSRGSGSDGSAGSTGSGSDGSASPQGSVAGGEVLTGACAACGTQNDADATFCKRCGAKLHEAAGTR
jgi:uncharacterized membrane protein YgcG